MAYKFQLGNAKLGGTLETSLASTAIDDTTAANVVTQIDDKEVPVTKLAVANGTFIVGDGSGIGQAVSMGGDVTMNNAGAVTIGTGVVEHAMLAGDCVDGDNIADDVVNSEHIAAGAIDTEHIADDQVTYAKIQNVSADERLLGRISGADGPIEELTQANVLTFLGVEAGATADQTNAEIRAAVEAATDSNVFTDADHSKLNGIEASATADQTAVEIVGLLNSDLGGNFTIGNQSDDTCTFGGNLTVTGDLTVNGDTTTISTTTLAVEDNNIVIRNGAAAADGSGITIGTSGTPVTFQLSDTASRLTSSVPLAASAFFGEATSATILANARTIGGVSFNGSANINLPGVNQAGNQDTSGTAAVATTVTVADESSDTSCNVLFTTAATGDLAPKSGTNLTFNSDEGILTATKFSGDGSLLTGIVAPRLSVNSKNPNDTLAYGVNLPTLGSDAHHLFRLPINPGNGDRIWIKAPSVTSADRTINVTGALANAAVVTIDGAAQIRLQSPDAAVMMVYCGSNAWKVF